MFTHHAEKRARQRGISWDQVNAVMTYGKENNCKGCLSYAHEEKMEKQMQADGLPPALISKCRGLYVICNGDTIVTVCHSKQKFFYH